MIEGLYAAYVLNAIWQLPLVLFVCIAALKVCAGAPASVKYWMLVVGALSAVVLPMSCLFGVFAVRSVVAPMDNAITAPLLVNILPAVAASITLAQFGRLVLAAIRTRALRRRATPAFVQDFQVRLLSAEDEHLGPILAGIRKPAILIPKQLLEPSRTHVLQAALAHEMAHVVRRDMLISLLCEVALAPLSFHPAAWVLRRKLAEEREIACDEHIIRQGMDPFSYARCLMDLARQSTSPAFYPKLLRIGANDALERRIHALIRRPLKEVKQSWRTASLALLMFAALGVIVLKTGGLLYVWVVAPPSPMRLIHLTPPPPPPPPPPFSLRR